MKGQQALFSSSATGGSDLWTTPLWLLDCIEQELSITIRRDVACDSDSNVVTRMGRDGRHSFCVDWDRDGLAEPWGIPTAKEWQHAWVEEVHGAAFCNPPYATTVDWVTHYMAQTPRPVCVWVVPARTDTDWWHQLTAEPCTVLFLRGRVNFGCPPGVTSKGESAAFPSAVILTGANRRHDWRLIDWRSSRRKETIMDENQGVLL
jgi:hypothetical protein